MNTISVVNKVSQELNIPSKIAYEAYKTYWEFIRETIEALPLKDNINEEEFNKLRTNFNIPSLGKLSCTFDRMEGVKKRIKYIRI